MLTRARSVPARFLAAALALTAAPAHSGAWPRDSGAVFLSVSQSYATGAASLLAPMTDLESARQVFAEYGLSPDWTIGIDASTATGQSVEDRTSDRVSAGLVFLRRPVWRTDAGQIAAVEFGVGVLQDGEGRQTRLRPGLAWGRGFTSRRGDGWLGVEASADLRLPVGDVALKADATAGLKPNDRVMLIAQLQSGLYPDGGAVVRLAPSAVYRIGKRSHVQLGINAAVVGDDAVGLKLSMWFSF